MSNSKRSELSSFTKRTAVVVGLITAFVAVGYFIYRTLNVILLLFLGVLFTVFLDMLACTTARHTPLSRKAALGIHVVVLTALFGAGAYFLAPLLGDQLGQLVTTAPKGLEALHDWLRDFAWGDEVWATIAPSTDVAEQVSGKNIRDAVFTTFGVLGDSLFVIISGLYMAISPKTYRNGVLSVIPPEGRERANEVMGIMFATLQRWLQGQLMAMAIVGTLFGVGLAILGVNLALVLGLIAGLLAFVPIVGSFLAVIPAVAVAMAQDPQLVLWVGVVYLAIQTLESYFITPMIQERAVSMPPVLLLTAQLVMYLLGGGLGVIVATPVAIFVIVIVREIYIKDFLGAEPVTDADTADQPECPPLPDIDEIDGVDAGGTVPA